MRNIAFEDYRLVCIQHGYFTCGTNDQFTKVYKMVNRGCTIGDLAFATWLCSESRFSYSEIFTVLNNLFR